MEWRAEAGEALGTFLLLLVGGAAVVTGQPALVVSLAFGGVVLVLVYALGHLSGAHFNPAITVAFALTRHFPWRRVGTYVAAQLAGALAACLLLTFLGPVDSLVARGTLPGSVAICVEALATFLLAFVIIAVATDRRSDPAVPGLAIGATVGLAALVAGPLTGAALNPARALAPAIVAGQYASLGPTLVGPFVGAAAGMLAYTALRRGARPAAPDMIGSSGPVDP